MDARTGTQGLLVASILECVSDDESKRLSRMVELSERYEAEAVMQAAETMRRSPLASARGALASFLTARRTIDGIRPHEREAWTLRELAGDVDDSVAATAIAGVGRLGDGRDLGMLVARSDDANPTVRQAAAFSLMLVLDGQRGAATTQVAAGQSALIALADDDCREVRSWALFGIGVTLRLRTPEALAAMRRHTDDADHETRCEALHGLALARDRDALLRALVDCDVDLDLLEVAVDLGDDEVCGALRDYRASGRWSGSREDLDEAIRRCEL